MDGPRIVVLGMLMRMERWAYDRMPDRPDLVVALVIDADLALKRKAHVEDASVIRAKTSAVAAAAAAIDDQLGLSLDASLPPHVLVDRIVSAGWSRLAAG